MKREITVTIYWDDCEILSLAQTRKELIESLEADGYRIKEGY